MSFFFTGVITLTRSNLREEVSMLALSLTGCDPLQRRRHSHGNVRQMITLHQQEHWGECLHSACFVLCSQGSLVCGATCTQNVFHSLLMLSGNTPTDTAKVCINGDSKSSHIDIKVNGHIKPRPQRLALWRGTLCLNPTLVLIATQALGRDANLFDSIL